MKIELLRRPLEQTFERERKILLLVVAIAVAVAWAGFIPQGFAVLGIQSGEIDPTGFTSMLALVILYFLISFSAHAVMDWKSWQWKLTGDDGERSFETLAELNDSIVPRRNLFSTVATVFFTNKIVFGKIAFDLLLPLAVGVYALTVLFDWEPPAAKMVAVIHAEPSAETKSSLVFINSGATFIREDRSDSLATIIVPFAREAVCDARLPPRQWTGTVVDQTHRAFLIRLGRDLSECGTERKPIRLQVQGFASSSKVADYAKCAGAKSSEEANLLIADARRDNVIRYLSREKGPYLQIDRHDWQGDFQRMQQKRRYIDRLMGEEYSRARGQLNRRVDVLLLNAGECEIADR